MRGREIALALLIIALGVLVTYEKSGRLDGWFEGPDGSWLGRDEYVYEEARDIDGPLPAEIQVINAHGRIEVTGTADSGPIRVVFRKHVYARNKTEADRVAAALRMTAAPSGPRLILETNRSEFERKRFSTAFLLAVPAGTAVVLKNSHGLVRAEAVASAEISNPNGDVVVRDLAGPLVLSSSYESVDVAGVGGNARIDAPHSRVVLKKIKGGLIVSHSYGKIDLEEIDGPVSIEGTHSKITARGLASAAGISTTYEAVRVEDAGAVTVRARHSDIFAKNIGGTLDVTNTYGRVRLENVEGELKIDGRNVAVEGRGVRSSDVFVKTTYENVFLAGVPGKVTVSLSHGRLNLEPEASLTGPVDVQGDYTDVRLLWPAGFRAPFQARIRDGRMIWNLPDPLDSEKSNGVTEVRAFSGAAGNPGVTIETAHGDVQVDAAGR